MRRRGRPRRALLADLNSRAPDRHASEPDCRQAGHAIYRAWCMCDMPFHSSRPSLTRHDAAQRVRKLRVHFVVTNFPNRPIGTKALQALMQRGATPDTLLSRTKVLKCRYQSRREYKVEHLGT